MGDCDICCDPFNKRDRRKIDCSCDTKACARCVKRYILDTTLNAHCMGCKKAWDIEFLSTYLTKVFLNTEYKNKRQDLLLEREKSMLPETMPIAEKEKQCRSIRKEIAVLISKNCLMHSTPIIPEENETPLVHLRKTLDREIECNKVSCDIRFLEYKIHYIRGGRNKVEARKFIRACPADDCRGFLSTQYKCGLCDIWVCPKCNEIIGNDKDAEHECTKENIESAEMIRKDTRPCPNCASQIFKIEGCDQMFCTVCHIAFSWRSGTIETGNVHNPHYFEYLRRNGQPIPRNPRDILCGGIPDASDISAKERLILGPEYLLATKTFTGIVRIYYHITDVDMIQLNPGQVVDRNRDMRIKYILGDFDDEYFKTELYKRERKINKDHDNLMVFEMYSRSLVDIVRRFMEPNINTVNKYYSLYDEYLRLTDYAVECFEKIAKRYSCVPKRITA